VADDVLSVLIGLDAFMISANGGLFVDHVDHHRLLAGLRSGQLDDGVHVPEAGRS